MEDKARKYFSTAETLAFGLLFWLAVLPVTESPLFRVVAVLSCALSLFLILKRRASGLGDWVGLPPPEASFRSFAAFFWFLALGTLLVAVLLYFERQQPFYFTQMDNHEQFLPVIVPALRGFFEQGIFPTWNGYQFLGVPTASLGYYGLTYPPLYLCYAAARYFYGNENLTLEFFIWLHLLAGYVVTFVLLRHMSARPSLAASGAFCFVMLGFNILFGVIWYYISPTVVYLPLLGLSLTSCMRSSPGIRWVIGTALAIGCYFHSGNVQMWSYGMLFWGLCMLWIGLCHRADWRHYLMPAASAMLAGVALAMPLLLIQTIDTMNVPRSPSDINISPLATSLLFPWWQATVTSDADEPAQTFVQNNPAMVFTGCVFALAFFLRFALDVAFLSQEKKISPKMTTFCFSLLALTGITLGLGSRGVLWNILEIFPPFSKFRMPVKISPFMGLFIVLSGASFIEMFLRRNPSVKLLGTGLAIVAVTLTLLSYQNTHPFISFVERNYPELPPELRKLQTEGFTAKGRVYPFSPYQPETKDFVTTLSLNFPSIYHIPVTGGYYLKEPLERGLPENRLAADFLLDHPLEGMNEYGVDTVLISTLPYDKSYPLPKILHSKEYGNARFMARFLRKNNFPETKLSNLDMFDVHSKHTKPMAYVEAFYTTSVITFGFSSGVTAAPNVITARVPVIPSDKSPAPLLPLAYRLQTNGVDVELNSLISFFPKPHILVANFIYRPWIKAWTNGGKKLEPYGDAFGRIAVIVPDDAASVIFRYCPPWRYGFYGAFLLLFLAVWILFKTPATVREAQ